MIKIPKDWEKISLNILFSFHGGLGISREQLGDKGIPYLHYGDMHKGNFSSVSYDDYVNLPKYDIEIIGDEDFLLKDGDVVFLDASEDLAGTSRCVVVDNPDNKPFIAGLHTFIARPLNNSLSKSYKKYFTQTQDVQKQFERLAVGFKVYGVNRNDIKKIAISFPKDIKEQKKIAKILTKCDEVIELQEQLIEKLEVQKMGLVKKLLTPQENWQKTTINKVCKITTGKLDANAMTPNGLYRFYTCANNYYLTDNYAYDTEALLISGNGANVGYIHYYIGKFNAYQRTYILTDFSTNAMFLKYYLELNLAKRIKEEIHEGNTPYIVLDTIAKMKYYFPDNSKNQQYIVNVISIKEKLIDLQKQKLTLLKRQRKSLMQLLLTGTIRVKT